MDAISKVPMAVIPTGGQREIPAEIGELFLQQIEMFTLRSALEINNQGDVVDATLAKLTPSQRATAHAIALSLANKTRGP